MTHRLGAGVTLVLGGARSGKSGFAERLASESGLRRVYVATAEAGDGEMSERIARHRADRGADWQTIEEPVALAATLSQQARTGSVVLVDCLTLWLTNLMVADADIDSEIDRFASGLPDLHGPVVLVSNEVGQGIVPDNAMARAFRDHAGRLHQAVAGQAVSVYFVTAGLAQVLKP